MYLINNQNFILLIQVQTMHPQSEDYKDKTFIINNLPELSRAKKQNLIDLNSQGSTKLINYVKEMIIYSPIQAVIALHAWQLLQPFLKGAVSFCQGKHPKDSMLPSVEFIVQMIYINSYACFLQGEKNYSALFQQKGLKNISEEQKNKKYFQKDPRTIVFRQLLTNLSKIVQISQKFEMRKYLNLFIENQLLVQDPTGFLQQISLNWIKKKVQQIQNEQKCYLCCRIHFERATTSLLLGFAQTNNQQFKDYRWPLENENIRKHLAKTVVGFLNTTGGIIYVGLKEDKSKTVEVKGIQLSAKQKHQFLQFMHDIITERVYPKEKDRKIYEQQGKDPNCLYIRNIYKQFQKIKSKERGYDYRIDDYMRVDFMDVFDGQTLLNSIGNSQRLYIVRIKINVGSPKELYHMISQTKHIPQAYLREDKSVKKKDMKQFYDLFYKRISGIQHKNMQNQRIDPHPLCRFNPNPLPSQYNQ